MYLWAGLVRAGFLMNDPKTMMKRFLLFFLLIYFSAGLLSGQSYVTKDKVGKKKLKQYEQALAYARDSRWGKALDILRPLTEDKNFFVDAWLLMGDVYYDGRNLAKAEETYERVLNEAPGYRVITWYKVAMCEWRQGKEKEAIAHLQTYLDTGRGGELQRKRAAKELEQLRFSVEAKKHPVPFEPRKLGPEINTGAAEYSPVLTADGEMLLFVRVTEEGGEDFYICRKAKDEWQDAEPLFQLNTPLNEGAPVISSDGKYLIFTACNRKGGYGSCDLYFSKRTSTGGWTPPENLGPPINTSAWESLPSLSPDGKLLYFASSREGGLGGKDIWVSKRLRNGKWSKPKNLGPNINTEDDELAPFIHADGKTLYFMSSGHPGMGGFDIYYSRLQDDGTWGKAVNMGYPINESGDEGALFVTPDGRTAFFASTGEKGGPGSGSSFESTQSRRTTDIYTFDLPEEARAHPATYAKIAVYDKETGSPLRAIVTVRDLKNKGRYIWRAQADEQGEMLCLLPLGSDYSLEIYHNGYLFYSDHFALAEEHSPDNPFYLSVGLIPVPKEEDLAKALKEPVVLRNVFFDSGSAELREESHYELDRLARLLKENYQLKIEIRGHTDEVGTEADNLALSQRRAKAVVEYLLAKGIDPSRLSSRGFGESQPVADNDTPEGRQLNRRTEFVVVGVEY